MVSDSTVQRVTILGATGSIGRSTLDVIRRHPDRYRVFALTANGRTEDMLELCRALQPRYAVMRDIAAADQLAAQVSAAGIDTEVLAGDEGLCQVAGHPQVDIVMAAIVGAAGLQSTLAAVQAGKKVLLANKEALVMAGGLFMQAVKESGAVLLPIDSEHNAIFQCLPHPRIGGLESIGVKRILLTGSGGPFRRTPLASLDDVTPEQACAHPNWSMGPKISVDSATMMNKGLELIEACWLFDCRPSQIDIVVHPQSIIHSMVEYIDGSVLAQLGNPDMRTPIAHGLAWPQRIDAGVDMLDIVSTARLDFEAPDMQRFACLRLAVEAAQAGGTAPIALNAANEEVVGAFLAGRIAFTDIAVIIEGVMAQISPREPRDLDEVKQADRLARQQAQEQLRRSFHLS